MTSLNQRLSRTMLPATVPVFPLSGAILLPQGRLPLNIFEPRYLAMVENALMTRQRLIGMIQPLQKHGEELYGIGCAGRIMGFEQTDDGRYQIVLEGVCRFHIGEELPTTRKYRQFTVDWDAFLADLEPAATRPVDRARLIEDFKCYFDKKQLLTDWDMLRVVPLDKLVTALSMLCPFSPPEKQALLEAKDTMARLSLLRTFMDMAVRATSETAEMLH